MALVDHVETIRFVEVVAWGRVLCLWNLQGSFVSRTSSGVAYIEGVEFVMRYSRRFRTRFEVEDTITLQVGVRGKGLPNGEGHDQFHHVCVLAVLCASMIFSSLSLPGVLSPSDSTAGRPHKAADTLADRNIITRLFYGCYPFFAFCCIGTELLYVSLYLLVFIPEAALELGPGLAITLHAVRDSTVSRGC